MNATEHNILVSDFDGTMTRHDFYKLVIESLIPADVPDYWSEYRAGSISHFEALRRYFAAIRASEADVFAVLERMELDPQLASSVDALRRSGWRIVVASAGCDWYIHRLLAGIGLHLEVHANPGNFHVGEGLLMKMPTQSPYWSPMLGIDKTNIVRTFLDQGRTVAFAGDGFPDAEPARLVQADLRFARGDLANTLNAEGLSYFSFAAWTDIANHLLRRSN